MFGNLAARFLCLPKAVTLVNLTASIEKRFQKLLKTSHVSKSSGKLQCYEYAKLDLCFASCVSSSMRTLNLIAAASFLISDSQRHK